MILGLLLYLILFFFVFNISVYSYLILFHIAVKLKVIVNILPNTLIRRMIKSQWKEKKEIYTMLLKYIRKVTEEVLNVFICKENICFASLFQLHLNFMKQCKFFHIFISNILRIDKSKSILLIDKISKHYI